MQGSNANGGATNTKVTQPLRLNVVILQGKRENTMHGAMLKYRNRFDDGDVIDVVALASCGLSPSTHGCGLRGQPLPFITCVKNPAFGGKADMACCGANVRL
jgi:hypothetical protein